MTCKWPDIYERHNTHQKLIGADITTSFWLVNRPLTILEKKIFKTVLNNVSKSHVHLIFTIRKFTPVHKSRNVDYDF